MTGGAADTGRAGDASDAARAGGAGAKPIRGTRFAALMAPLGAFGPAPRLAAGVSGGADSMALALLASAWARERGGSLLALVVDHGLRPESAAEATQTLQRLAARGIPARRLVLTGLARGPALAERARAARYAALRAACAEAGILHLLLGHHAADQAETVLIRQLGHSGPAGLAGMPVLAALCELHLLRPLLGVPPVRLRATLRAAGVGWVEDPSNADLHALRPRLRAALADPDGTGPDIAALCAGAHRAGIARAAQEAETAEILAERVALHPEGFALLSPGPGLPPAAFSAAAASGVRRALSARIAAGRRAGRRATPGDARRRAAAAGRPARPRPAAGARGSRDRPAGAGAARRDLGRPVPPRGGRDAAGRRHRRRPGAGCRQTATAFFAAGCHSAFTSRLATWQFSGRRAASGLSWSERLRRSAHGVRSATTRCRRTFRARLIVLGNGWGCGNEADTLCCRWFALLVRLLQIPRRRTRGLIT